MNIIIKKFEQYYLNENVKTNDDNLLEKVSRYISKRFKKDDEKLVYTYWIGKIFNYNKFLFVSKIEMSEELKDVCHVYIILEDKYFDGTGFHTREEIYEKFHISKYSYNDYTFYGDLNLLNKCVDIKKSKLSTKLENELKIVLQKIKDESDI